MSFELVSKSLARICYERNVIREWHVTCLPRLRLPTYPFDRSRPPRAMTAHRYVIFSFPFPEAPASGIEWSVDS